MSSIQTNIYQGQVPSFYLKMRHDSATTYTANVHPVFRPHYPLSLMPVASQMRSLSSITLSGSG
jgi:hypothetical protein